MGASAVTVAGPADRYERRAARDDLEKRGELPAMVVELRNARRRRRGEVEVDPETMRDRREARERQRRRREGRHRPIGPTDRRGAGGAKPPSYPDPGHLRIGPVPDGTFSGEVERGEIVEAPRTPDQLRPWHLAGEDAARELSRHGEWLSELVLRSAIEAATGRPIVDPGDRAVYPNRLACRASGHLQEHARVAGAVRLQAHTCKVRARCPHCGRVYGLEQGAELESLLDAAWQRSLATDPRRLPGDGTTVPIAWGMVVTLPAAVSRYLGRLADDVWGGDELKRELRRFTAIVRRVVARLIHGPRLEAASTKTERDALTRELGAAINFHFWSSSNPTGGHHWHAHVLVPNLRGGGVDGVPAGGRLRDVGKFAPWRLEAARLELLRAMSEAWPALVPLEAMQDAALEAAVEDARVRRLEKPAIPWRLVPVGSRPNLSVSYFANDEPGRAALAKRCRYDARHPFQDLLKQSRIRPARVYGDAELGPLAAIAERVERLQRVKLRRYLGWMAPGQRKQYGLTHDGDDSNDPEWTDQPGGRVRIVGMTERGVRVRRVLDRGGLGDEFVVPGRDVVSEGDRGGRRWEWKPPERAGPPHGELDKASQGIERREGMA